MLKVEANSQRGHQQENMIEKEEELSNEKEAELTLGTALVRIGK
jgi:hypothetical protein